MRWTYDTRAGALYVYFATGGSVRQEEPFPGAVIDFDAMGSIVGLEVIRPWRVSALAPVLSAIPLDAGQRAFLEKLLAWPLFQSTAPRSQLVPEVREPAGTSARVLALAY